MDWILLSQLTLGGFIGSIGLIFVQPVLPEIRTIVGMLCIKLPITVGVCGMIYLLLLKNFDKDHTAAFCLSLMLGAWDLKEVKKVSKDIVMKIMNKLLK